MPKTLPSNSKGITEYPEAAKCIQALTKSYNESTQKICSGFHTKILNILNFIRSEQISIAVKSTQTTVSAIATQLQPPEITKTMESYKQQQSTVPAALSTIAPKDTPSVVTDTSSKH